VDNINLCKSNIERMLKRSQTKVIFPIITLGLLKKYDEDGESTFSDSEIRKCYEKAVRYMKNYLGHDLHIGGKYYDAYPSRNLPKYGVLKVLGNQRYELLDPFLIHAKELTEWIPEIINQHINKHLGIVPRLGDQRFRAEFADDSTRFLQIIEEYASGNPANFEIFSFAIIKVHLEKFACRIYRDSRTATHDKGVDISTNFGVVYQIKKLKVFSIDAANNIYAELKANFDTQRLNEGSVVLIIDDISKEIKRYLVNMKIQSISKIDIMKLAQQFDDREDREKVLRIVYEEFNREYSSDVR
jgi:hypothetical protein